MGYAPQAEDDEPSALPQGLGFRVSGLSFRF
jgi:hypothetical protein